MLVLPAGLEKGSAMPTQHPTAHSSVPQKSPHHLPPMGHSVCRDGWSAWKQKGGQRGPRKTFVKVTGVVVGKEGDRLVDGLGAAQGVEAGGLPPWKEWDQGQGPPGSGPCTR